jgi:phosphoglycerate dehydrogenase-like enzyme
MKIFMIGEAANHADKLAAGLRAGCEIVPLPVAAASSDAHDAAIGPDDAVISLRFRRPGGKASAFSLLHVPGAGLDGIDFDCLSPHTTVCNVFEHEIPIAEFVMAQMLEWEIRATAMRSGFTAQNWSTAYRNRVPHGELHGKTLGIVGFGRIGQAIAVRARAFGMHVVAIATRVDSRGVADRTLPPALLGEMLAEADYVALACPLNETTRGLIGKRELELMKRDGVLINVSRAEIVDEAALFEALQAKAIGGAVLDVWYRYPAGADDTVAPSAFPFDTLENAVCTPHSSAWTTALPYRRYARIADNIERLRRGDPLTNVVRSSASVTPDQVKAAHG